MADKCNQEKNDTKNRKKKNNSKRKTEETLYSEKIANKLFFCKEQCYCSKKEKKITGKCFTNLLFKKEASTHLQNNEGTQVWTNTDMLIQSLSNRRR